MRYKSSSLYVQRQTDKMLRFYKHFVRIYINDIIIFSRILKEYLRYLQMIFQLFRNKKVSLTSTKLFFNYSLITLLE